MARCSGLVYRMTAIAIWTIIVMMIGDDDDVSYTGHVCQLVVAVNHDRNPKNWDFLSRLRR